MDQWWGYVFIKADEIEECCTDIDTFINTARKELPDVFDQMMKFHIVEAHMRVVNLKIKDPAHRYFRIYNMYFY